MTASFLLAHALPDDVRLQSPDAAVRRLALIDAAESEDDACVPLLIHALRHDTDAGVRRTAAEALGAWELPDAVDALCDGLHDGDTSVRTAAADSLAGLKQSDLGLRLLARLDDPDTEVRTALLRALRELRLPQSAAPAQQQLSHASAAVRREAVGVLGWLRHAPALPGLAALAQRDPEPEVRRAAVGALAFAVDDSVLPTLVDALLDNDWQVREEAAATLGKLHLIAARIALEAALDDTYWQVALQAARALGRLGQSQSAHAVATLLTYPISNVRKEAALALGEIGTPADLIVLEASLQDDDPEVRKAARIAIAQIGQRLKGS